MWELRLMNKWALTSKHEKAFGKVIHYPQYYYYFVVDMLASIIASQRGWTSKRGSATFG
jgi:hypothetical protein